MSDIYWDQTTLLLHCEGLHSSTDILDSAYGVLLHAKGNAALTTAQKPFGTSSLTFDGNGDSVQSDVTEICNFGTGDFTIEFKVRFGGATVAGGGASNDNLISMFDNPGIAIGVSSTSVHIGPYNAALVLTATHALTVGSWHDMAFTRAAGVGHILLDGVLLVSGAFAANLTTSASKLVIGGDSTQTNFNGQLKEIRVTKGVARYTSNYTHLNTAFAEGITASADDQPADYINTVGLVLPGDGVAGEKFSKDHRHNNYVITAGAEHLWTNTKQLFGLNTLRMLAANALKTTGDVRRNLGTSDFTFETHIAVDAAGMTPVILGTQSGSSGFYLAISSTGQIYANINSSPSFFRSYITYGKLHHIALVRARNVLYLYVDGVPGGAFGITESIDLSEMTPFGSYGAGSNTYNGFCGGYRLTKSARYAGRFKPPTKPFKTETQYDSAWPSVVLAMPMNGTPGNAVGIADLKGHVATSFGDAKISTAKAVYNSTAAYYDGTGDYTTLPTHADFGFGTGDFTVDMHVYLTAGGGTLLDIGAGKLALERPNNSQLTVTMNGVAAVLTTAASTFGINRWDFLSVQRAAGILTVYLAGVQLGQRNNADTSANLGASAGVVIAADSTFANRITGYVGGLRITKGVARYTGSFAAPTEPFPTLVPQSLSGITHDAAGNPTGRTVRSHRRSDGKVIGTATSDPITGVFSLPADSLDEHYVVILDPVKNAIVFDHITPVI